MSGTPHGVVDCVLTSTPTKEITHSMFKSLFDLLNSMTGSGIVTRIAYNTGSNGTGTGYYDEPSPFGNNAWYCYRFNASASSLRTADWYLLVQNASGSGNFGDAPGDPGLVNASSEGQSSNEGTLAFAAAGMVTAAGANANPWNGTTNNDGTDSKGDPVWNSGSVDDVLSVLPRSNNNGGSHDSSRENMAEAYNSTQGSADVRFHFIADNDGLAFFIDNGDNLTYACNYVGHYSPRAEISSSAFVPLLMFIRDGDGNAQPTSFESLGTTTGDGFSYEGGVTIPAGVRVANLAKYESGWMESTTFQPNTALNVPLNDVFAPVVLADEDPNTGQIGFLDTAIYAEIYNVNVHDTNSDQSRTVFSTVTTTEAVKVFTAWSGSAGTPGTGTSRSGSFF